MMRLPILAVCLVAATPAVSAESLVGRWCSGDGNNTVIGAMSLRNDDVSCAFKTVKRRGATVIWRGVCSDVEGDTTETVTARVKAGKLTYRFSPGGNEVGPLSKCR
jgi:hypothetical protein